MIALWMTLSALAAEPTQRAEAPGFQLAGRSELSASVAREGSPFTHRVALSVSGRHHLSEAVTVELRGTFLPNFGQAEWRQRRLAQLRWGNWISPDLVRLRAATEAGLEFAPIQGMVSGRGEGAWALDPYASLGLGLGLTHDDLDAIQCDSTPGTPCQSTARQWHPTTQLGLGVRIHRRNLVLRAELRRLSWIDAIDGTALELKHRSLMGLSVGWLLPRGG